MFIRLVLVSSLVIFCGSVLAQPGGGPPPDPGEPVPFSGIEILIAAGAALGAKKFFSLRKKQ